MNKLLSAHFLGLILAATAQAQGVPHPSEENAGLGIEQVGVLVYPSKMLGDAVYSGEARAVISVDENGRLTDCLITGFTQEAFAETALAAIKRWRYEPAKVNGRLRASRADLLFEFRDKGVIVQTFPGALLRHAYRRNLEEHFVYKPCLLRDLDRIPTPVHVISPVAIPVDTTRSVTVEFYIDEEGRVRMPAVDRAAADDPLAGAAVAAVEQWRFEPPLRKGRPVLVYAQQEFSFHAKD